MREEIFTNKCRIRKIKYMQNTGVLAKIRLAKLNSCKKLVKNIFSLIYAFSLQ